MILPANKKSKASPIKEETSTVYRTSDDKTFLSMGEAEAHEKKLGIRAEFQDLVNRLVILMENNNIWTPEYTMKHGDGSPLLKELKEVVNADFDEDSYYNSNCY